MCHVYGVYARGCEEEEEGGEELHGVVRCGVVFYFGKSFLFADGGGIDVKKPSKQATLLIVEKFDGYPESSNQTDEAHKRGVQIGKSNRRKAHW